MGASGTVHPTLTDTATELRHGLLASAAARDDVISLGRGDPDLPTPAHIVEAAKEAMRRGEAFRMAAPEGIPELRQAIADKLGRDHGIEADPETEIIVTTGGQEAFFLLMQAIVNPGDEVLVPDPRYTSYDPAIRCARGELVPVPTSAHDGFDVQPEEVRRLITPRTRVLLLISPGNPTAAVISPANVRLLAELAREHDLFVISDEIYERYLYDGAEQVSIGSLPGMKERTATLNAVSKAYAMTGWRVGYVAAPAPVVAAMTRLKTTINRSTSTLSQWAAHAALSGPQGCIEEYRQIYVERRRALMAGLEEMRFACGRPQGGLFVFPHASALGMSSDALCQRVLEQARVLLLPGSSYGDRGREHVRISFLAPKEQIEEALARMKAALLPG